MIGTQARAQTSLNLTAHDTAARRTLRRHRLHTKKTKVWMKRTNNAGAGVRSDGTRSVSISGAISRQRGQQAEAGPSRTDFDRNFEASSPAEELSEPEYGGEDDEEEEGYAPAGDDEPLIPGTYRALYPFEPEGTAEMALEEEQVVHVIGRGGGVGWAIVEKEGGGHALVPESYLELIQPDEHH